MPILGPDVGISKRDLHRLFLTKGLRMFAYGFLSIALVLYLVQIGLTDVEVGLLLALTLVGDTVVSLILTTRADRYGRRNTLLIGAGLMLFASVVFVLTNNFLVLLIAAIIGVISPSGNEVGPFLSVEQAALAQIVPGRERTKLFAWYNLVGSLSTASGALVAGLMLQVLQGPVGVTGSYEVVIVCYGVLGGLLALVFLGLTKAVEVPAHEEAKSGARFGLHRSKRTVLKLAALFSLDAFGGGFIVQSVMAYFFVVRFNADPAVLGAIFFAANILAGISALLAARIASRIGLIRAMVFTHLPSNLLLIGVPFMPTFELALLLLLLRFSISQMDVPTRQAYVCAVVQPDERSAANGITGVARTIGQSIALIFVGLLIGSESTIGYIFVIAGGIKVVYDLLVFQSFRSVKPLEDGVK